jgi:hypothetical protein
MGKACIGKACIGMARNGRPRSCVEDNPRDLRQGTTQPTRRMPQANANINQGGERRIIVQRWVQRALAFFG